MKSRVLLATVAGIIAGTLIVLAWPPPSERPPASAKVPKLAKVPARTVLAWTPVRLPSGFAGRVAKVPGVRAVTEVRSGIAWLSAWGPKHGPEARPPKGFRIPVEVASINTATYMPFLPAAERNALDNVEYGDVLIGRTESRLRRLGAGANLTFGPTATQVFGVVADELVGAHELVVSRATGNALGIVRPRYLLAALRDDASLPDVERAIKSAAGAGVRVRVRAPGETPQFRHGDAVLALVKIKELFGEFAAAPAAGGALRVDPAWTKANIETIRVPRIGSMRCHKRIATMLRSAFAEIERRGLGHLIDRGQFGGCHFPRFLSQDPEAGLSHHSWGVAFDINVSSNPFGRQPRMDRRLVEIFERWGFTWGGRWLVPDGMHFEFLRFPASR